MSNKYFGQFLVEKKIITEDILVEALIKQLRTSKMFFEVLYEKKNLNASAVLKVFEEQQKNDIDFRSAAKNLELWKEDYDSMIEHELKISRTPLGQILVEQGLIDLKQLTLFLDEFLATKKAPSQNFTTVNLENLLELRDAFDEQKFVNFENTIMSLKGLAEADQEARQNLLKNSLSIVQTINGLVFLLDLKLLPQLLDKIIEAISKYIGKSPESGMDELFSQSILSAIELSWTIKESVVSTQSEASFYSNETDKKRFEEIFIKLSDFC